MSPWKLINRITILFVFSVLTSGYLFAEPPFGYQAVPKDAFHVFDNPSMLSGHEAEKQGYVFDRDAVIGVEHNGEAKAYPITTMGYIELGNDTIGGIPIAVGW